MIEQIRAKLKQWRDDPVSFVVEQFGVTPDPWQAEVLRAFPHKQRIAMKAAKGCGKTTVLAWLIWNYLATRPFPKVVATSISGDNLADTLWPEMARWQDVSLFLKTSFTWTKTRIFSNDHPENWFASARAWSRSANSQQQADTLAGIHADYVMFVLDESGGIPDSVMAAAEAGLTTGPETRLVQAGNPTHLEGPLYRACTAERHLWEVVEITGDPDNPNRSPRISIEWAREQIARWGSDNPWVMVNVFGKFPPGSINSLIGPDEVREAMARHLLSTAYEYSQRRIGIDVARFGDDRTIIFPRQGLAAFRSAEMRNATGPEIAARAALARERWEWEMAMVDDTGGYGASAIDSMGLAGLPVVPINFSGKAIDPRYYNIRAEMWFNMAKWIRAGGSLPNDPELVRELTAPTYTFHNGKFLLEDKDQIKKRLTFSPDKADALALTFAIPDAPTDRLREMAGVISNRHQSEWDPLEEKK